MRKLNQREKAEPLAKCVCELLFPYKGEAVRTITTDNGSEFARHEKITQKTGAPVFFTDSDSTHQCNFIIQICKKYFNRDMLC